MSYSFENLLVTALNCSSPAGYEDGFCEWFSETIKDFVNYVYSDVLGNVIAYKKNHGEKKVVLVAHADEVGFMVTNINEQGFVSIRPIGALDASILSGTIIEIHGYKKTIKGVVGKNAIHIQRDEAATVKFENLWVDVGISSKEEVMRYIRIGDYATFTPNYLKQNGTIVCSKALDDKIGIIVLLELAKRLKNENINCDIYFVASVQEELGSRGVRAATSAICPDICIAIDVTHANDYPTAPVITTDIRLGNGTVITLGPNVDKKLGDQLIALAEKNGINYQIEPFPCPTGTDARVVQNSCLGVRTAVLSIPCRYMHTPVEIISLKDADDTISLLYQYITSL